MLNSYFDNKIDPMNDRLLADHIKSCPECTTQLNFLIEYRDNLKTVKPLPAPDNFLSELHKRIDSETKSGGFTKVFDTVKYIIGNFNFPLEAAGVLTIAMIVFFLYRPFFNETLHKKNSEFTIESPVEESPAKINTRKTGSTKDNVNQDKFESDYNNTKEKMNHPWGEVTQRDEAPLYNTADDKISSKTEIPVSESVIEMKKSRSVKNEKTPAMDEEKSLSNESYYGGIDAEDAADIQKNSAAAALSYPVNLFKKYNVSVVKKDLSRSNKAYYRIKIDLNRYSSFISDLKENSSIDVKVITKTETFYEIEFFIKNNEN
jgi:hypothetical protein